VTSVLRPKYDESFRSLYPVIPAKAGIHDRVFDSTPRLDARLRGHDDSLLSIDMFNELLTQDTSEFLTFAWQV
jgi:hypothetical protein